MFSVLEGSLSDFMAHIWFLRICFLFLKDLLRFYGPYLVPLNMFSVLEDLFQILWPIFGSFEYVFCS